MRFIFVSSFLIYSIALFSQEELKENTTDSSSSKNQITTDVEALAISISYNKNISKKFQLGFSIGGGLRTHYKLNPSKNINIVDVFSFEFPLRFNLNRKTQFETSLKYSLIRNQKYIYQKKVFQDGNEINEQVFLPAEFDWGVGIVGGIFFGGKIIKYGFRFEAGRLALKPNEYYLRSSFLILRINTSKW